jgi:hypothetical protein
MVKNNFEGIRWDDMRYHGRSLVSVEDNVRCSDFEIAPGVKYEVK